VRCPRRPRRAADGRAGTERRVTGRSSSGDVAVAAIACTGSLLTTSTIRRRPGAFRRAHRSPARLEALAATAAWDRIAWPEETAALSSGPGLLG
jgi:hypothetical protein